MRPVLLLIVVAVILTTHPLSSDSTLNNESFWAAGFFQKCLPHPNWFLLFVQINSGPNYVGLVRLNSNREYFARLLPFKSGLFLFGFDDITLASSGKICESGRA